MLGTVAGQSVLASRLDGQAAVFQSILLFGTVILATVLGVVFLLHLRRRFRNGGDSRDRWLSLDTLRKLRDCGKITTSEYDALREQTIRAMRTDLSSGSRSSVR